MTKDKRLSFFAMVLIALLGIYFVAGFAILSGNMALTGAIIQFSPPPPDVGILNVTSDPSGASVYDGTQYKGITPLVINGMSVGGHYIKLSKSGYEDYADYSYIVKNVMTNLSVTLTPLNTSVQVGNIYVTSTPSASFVYLNNTIKGITSLSISDLTPGNWVVKVTKSGYYDYENAVNVVGGNTTNVNAVLVARTGNLHFSTTPSGASVYVDNIYKGVSPVLVTGLIAGVHGYSVSKTGYFVIISSATVTENQTTNITLVLASTEEPPQENVTYYTLTVAKTGNGDGEINSGPDPAAIKCGSDCSESYANGTSVTVYALPSANSTFAGWSGACSGASASCTLLMNSNKNAIANFTSNTSSGGGGTPSPTAVLVYVNATDKSVYAQDTTDNGTFVGFPRRIVIGSLYRQIGNMSLSHDAKRLLFAELLDIAYNGVFLIDISCPEPTCSAQRILDSIANLPEWSPDDTKILYYNRSYSLPYSNIVVYNFATGGKTRVRHFNYWEPILNGGLTWSNSGINITFANSSYLKRAVTTMPGSCIVGNYCMMKNAYFASFSSDYPYNYYTLSAKGYSKGTSVAFSDNKSVNVVPYDGSAPKRVVISGNYPVWSPNGEWLIYSTGEAYSASVDLNIVNSNCNNGVGCSVRTLASGIAGGMGKYDWQSMSGVLSAPEETTSETTEAVPEATSTVGPISPATSSTIMQTVDKIESASDTIQDPMKQIEVNTTTTKVKETVQQLAKLENEQVQRGFGYGFGWFFGFAADQEKKDAAFMILQATKLRTSSKTLLRVSETLTEPAKSIVADQANLLAAQANDLLKKADAKKKNARGILSFIIGQ